MEIVDNRQDDDWYLRRTAEDELVAGSWALLPARARALVAVGRMSQADAVTIVGSYQRAHALRGRYEGDFEPPEDPSTRLTDLRVSACSRTVTQPWGTVRLDHVVWTGRETRLAAALTETTTGAVPMATHGALSRHAMMHGGPPSLSIVDERGRTHEGHFSGGSSGTEWDGTFVFAPGLAADASWFTIYGERIDLAPTPTDITVRLEASAPDATPENRAERYLDFCLETAQHRYAESPDEIDVAIDTFVTTGVLSADSAAIRGVRAASEALGDTTWFGHRHRRRKANRQPDLPARWQSVLDRRGRTDGIVTDRVVGAITPPFDGIVACVVALRTRADDFEIAVDAVLSPDPLQSQEHSPMRFTVTAVDDRDNHYLGETREWNGSEDGMSGTVGFGAPVDPLATTIEIQISGGIERALVTVPLPGPGVS